MKSNIADKEMQKIRQALAAQQKEKRDPKILERAIKGERNQRTVANGY